MSCTQSLFLAPLLFMLALTNDPGLFEELVDALLDAHPDALPAWSAPAAPVEA